MCTFSLVLNLMPFCQAQPVVLGPVFQSKAKCRFGVNLKLIIEKKSKLTAGLSVVKVVVNHLLILFPICFCNSSTQSLSSSMNFFYPCNFTKCNLFWMQVQFVFLGCAAINCFAIFYTYLCVQNVLDNLIYLWNIRQIMTIFLLNIIMALGVVLGSQPFF